MLFSDSLTYAHENIQFEVKTFELWSLFHENENRKAWMGWGNGFEQLTITEKGKSNPTIKMKEKFGPGVGWGRECLSRPSSGSVTESEAGIYLFLCPSEGVA